MRYNKIVIAGGNGYLGNVFSKYYAPLSAKVLLLSRSAAAANGNITTQVWDGRQEGDWIHQLEGADLLINLCGKNVNCRYTTKNRREILDSRLTPTRLLGKVIQGLQTPPRLWINVTSATIYRHADDHGQDEYNGEIGSGFSVEVCKQWEAAFFETKTPGTRKIALRMGIVLGAEDGVFPRLLKLVQWGLGGKQGPGTQMVSWIHEQDAARVTEWLFQNHILEGVFNCTAQTPVSNAELMRTIRTETGKRIGLPAPDWLLEAGARLIGTETELLLKSRWVLPKRLLKTGYPFLYNDIQTAVKAILQHQ
ncbi:MAG: TIGR01777 family oxidoreductase [Chitinophagaceae bacterium]